MPAVESPRRTLAAALALAVVAFLMSERVSLADGAFPDSQTIMVPGDRPNQIVVGTNFGVVISSNGGNTWLWSCEQQQTANGRLYQMGPPPGDRLFAVGHDPSGLPQIVYSDDEACSWRVSGGALSTFSVQDVFVDPVNADRVFAVGSATTDAGTLEAVLVSGDGGRTFDQTVYQGGAGELILGVESARSDPNRVYLSLADSTGHPGLARSSDGGMSWEKIDLGTALPTSGQLRIVAVDPTRATRIYLRWTGAPQEELLISDDSGSTVTTALAIPSASMTSFVRMAAGTILVGALGDGALLFRSEDDGASFSSITTPPPPLLRAIAERSGILYAATDNLDDQFVAAISSDQGSTWQPILTTDGMGAPGVAAIPACLNAACQTDCLYRAASRQWSESVCSAEPPAMDAGGDAAHHDAAIDDAAHRTEAGTDKRPAPGGGCACSLGPHEPGGALATIWAALALGWAVPRRRWRQRRRVTFLSRGCVGLALQGDDPTNRAVRAPVASGATLAPMAVGSRQPHGVHIQPVRRNRRWSGWKPKRNGRR